MTLATDAVGIARAGIAAVDPRRRVAEVLRKGVDALAGVGGTRGARRSDPLKVFAFGKAAEAMVLGARDALGDRIVGGVLVVRDRPRRPIPGFEIHVGEHPVPGPGSFRAGQAMERAVRAIGPGERVLFLVSGGSSSLLELPATGLRGSDLARTDALLLGSGAPIGATNVLRRHLSAIKGGRLAEATRARVGVTLAISDVLGDRPWDIGSGPTVADPTTYVEALDAARTYRILDRLPKAVRGHLERGVRGLLDETPKPGRSGADRFPFHLVASNAIAVSASVAEAGRRGYRAHRLPVPITGEAADVGRWFGGVLAALSTGPPIGPFALVGGGETTVTLSERPGVGGRNQELALAAVGALAGVEGVACLSVGTDGIDGRTRAAGAVVTGRTAEDAAHRGVDLAQALARHDSHPTLARLGALVVTGPTG
ncbi:MAG TPA: DUF4147 domain-containing protein, partial [Thermoplasmata archaeon]|nr:DUF4147 domain-containing protein [Thermoplasmata archaeon]